DLKHWRQGSEMLSETSGSAPETTFRKLLYNQRNERHEEDDEDGKNATANPVDNWLQLLAVVSLWFVHIGYRYIWVVLAHDYLVSDSAELNQNQHEELDRKDNEDVVDVE